MLSWAYSEFQTFITYGIVNILSHRHIHCCFVIQEIQGVFDDFRVKALLHEGHFAVFKSSSDINCVLKKTSNKAHCCSVLQTDYVAGQEAGQGGREPTGISGSQSSEAKFCTVSTQLVFRGTPRGLLQGFFSFP